MESEIKQKARFEAYIVQRRSHCVNCGREITKGDTVLRFVFAEGYTFSVIRVLCKSCFNKIQKEL